jgi:hypothetical protein
MAKHVEINQHLREILVDSDACYVHLRIPVPTPPALVDKELSDWEEIEPVDAVHVSDGSEFEDSDIEPLIRRLKASLSQSPLIASSFFFTPPSLGAEAFSAPLTPGAVLVEARYE